MIKTNYESQITTWIKRDNARMSALEIASELGLNDWYLSAGFIRNLVWDNLHKKTQPTPLNDIDLIYFDKHDTTAEADNILEQQLKCRLSLPWSVKNQARMHIQNNHQPYSSSSDAMSYWPEIETAVGARLANSGDLEFVAPFGLSSLFNQTITLNPKCTTPEVFVKRLERKRWLALWPELHVNS